MARYDISPTSNADLIIITTNENTFLCFVKNIKLIPRFSLAYSVLLQMLCSVPGLYMILFEKGIANN